MTEINLYAPSNAAEVDAVAEEEVVAPLAESTSTDYLQVIKASTPKSSDSGKGIKIGMVEEGVPYEDERDNYNVIDCYPKEGDPMYVYYKETSHAGRVADIIHTIAPDAEIYCASRPYREGNDVGNAHIWAVEWLLDKGVNIINTSCAIGQDSLNTYSDDAKWLDHISCYHNAVVVNISGNIGANGVVSGGMSYNSITVGAVEANGAIWVSFGSGSSYNTMSSNWASKPDLCAPGVAISSAGLEPLSGTSFAAPQVTGDIALMCEQNPSLLYQPETIKAILTAGVNRAFTRCVTQPALSSNAYTQYGAGTLDCTRNYQLISSGCFRNGTLDTSVSGAYEDHTLTLGSGVNLRVSLAYLRIVELPSFDNHLVTPTEKNLSNLEIEILYNGTVVAGSLNATNNVKIVEHTTTQSGTYTIRVRSKSIVDVNAYYGVAWTVSQPTERSTS